MASHRTPSTGALERFCEFFSCMQLEYCLRESLSKFEGLTTFYCNFINVNILYCIYGTYDPFLLYVLQLLQYTEGSAHSLSQYTSGRKVYINQSTSHSITSVFTVVGVVEAIPELHAYFKI